MNFEQSKEFKKELIKLQKKWPTISHDLEISQATIESVYIEQSGVNLKELRNAFFNRKKATIILRSEDNEIEVVKMRLKCTSPGASTKLRIIFVAIKVNDRIIFIEIFSKSDKTKIDDYRIKRYLNELK